MLKNLGLGTLLVASVVFAFAANNNHQHEGGCCGSKAKAATVAVAALRKAPKKSGAGKIIGLGIVAAAALGVGYVLWQTFRADDELWVEEDA